MTFVGNLIGPASRTQLELCFIVLVILLHYNTVRVFLTNCVLLKAISQLNWKNVLHLCLLKKIENNDGDDDRY